MNLTDQAAARDYATTMAADNQLVAAGFILSMLTEPRPVEEQTELLSTALACIRRAMELLR